MRRGIVVRFSQYIGDGSTAFQPMDNSGTPHWKYTEVTDTIHPDQTRDLIRVVKIETKYDAGIPAPCLSVYGRRIHTMGEVLSHGITGSLVACSMCH